MVRDGSGGWGAGVRGWRCRQNDCGRGIVEMVVAELVDMG